MIARARKVTFMWIIFAACWILFGVPHAQAYGFGITPGDTKVENALINSTITKHITVSLGNDFDKGRVTVSFEGEDAYMLSGEQSFILVSGENKQYELNVSTKKLQSGKTYKAAAVFTLNYDDEMLEDSQEQLVELAMKYDLEVTVTDKEIEQIYLQNTSVKKNDDGRMYVQYMGGNVGNIASKPDSIELTFKGVFSDYEASEIINANRIPEMDPISKKTYEVGVKHLLPRGQYEVSGLIKDAKGNILAQIDKIPMQIEVGNGQWWLPYATAKNISILAIISLALIMFGLGNKKSSKKHRTIATRKGTKRTSTGSSKTTTKRVKRTRR